jgi:hypothetical protein
MTDNPLPELPEPPIGRGFGEDSLLRQWARAYGQQCYAAGVQAERAANICLHDETERLGAIWTRCTQCGKRWADDDPESPFRKG